MFGRTIYICAVGVSASNEPMEKVTLEDAFESFSEHWDPRIAGRLNGQEVKLATVEGEFVWHQHEDADELFLVVSGELRIELREESDIVLEDGDFVIVPRGVEHRPVAPVESDILLFEPRDTRNTGDRETDRTRDEAKWIQGPN